MLGGRLLQMRGWMPLPYLEAFVLQNSLDGGVFTAGRQLGLEDNTKGAIANDLALRVLHLFCLSCQAILDLFANNLCRGRQ